MTCFYQARVKQRKKGGVALPNVLLHQEAPQISLNSQAIVKVTKLGKLSGHSRQRTQSAKKPWDGNVLKCSVNSKEATLANTH